MQRGTGAHASIERLKHTHDAALARARVDSAWIAELRADLAGLARVQGQETEAWLCPCCRLRNRGPPPRLRKEQVPALRRKNELVPGLGPTVASRTRRSVTQDASVQPLLDELGGLERTFQVEVLRLWREAPMPVPLTPGPGGTA